MDDAERVSDVSEEEEGEEEEEPILKYSRFEGDISDILTNDSISSFFLCPASIVLGSHNGIIYILDLKGTQIKKYRAHSAAVASVSTDKGGLTVVSAGIDGRVVSFNLAKQETSMYDFKRPLKAVALDPEYHQNGKGRIISGGLAGQLILTEKGWVGNKETVLSTNEGPITEIVWYGHLVAWSNDQGVRVYDLFNMRMVGLIERRPNSPRADLFRCRLLWQDHETLIIGWFDHITKVVIQEGVGKVLNLDTSYIMRVDCVVAGLAMFGKDLLLMAYTADLQEIQDSTSNRCDAARPEIRIVNSKFEEISEDALGLRGYAKLQPNDYALFSHPTEKSFFIISPKDIILACERDTKDHVQWLLEMQKYNDALNASQDQIGLPFELTYGEIGRKYMAHLIGTNKFQDAAQLAPKILIEDVEAWEKLVFMFAEKGQLESITPYVPIGQPTLSSTVYEMALAQYLNSNQEMFLATVQKWPIEIYNVDDIVNATEHKLMRNTGNKVLREAVAELFLKTDRPRDALPHYLILGKSETFELIKQFHLFDAVQDSVSQLVHLDVAAPMANMSPLSLANQEAINMLVQHSHSIPMQKVVAQLEDRPALLYCYFRAMLDFDPQLATEYSDLQISLYAEYDRDKLMELLRTTNTYSLETAAKICEARDYIPELVFILGKTGNNKKALRLIIEKLGDIKQAIAFAYSQADADLWEDLIRYSLDKPVCIRGLLENAGTAIDPVSLIRRIPTGLAIEGLKESLLKIFCDLDLQLSLSQCGSSIHKSEISVLATRLRAGQRRGLSVDPTTVCRSSDVFLFFDGRRVESSELDEEVVARSGDARNRRQRTTAGKITQSAIFKSRLMTHGI